MELSWSELMVVGIVALIIIGPKDLPGMFRELGRFTAKIRAMGREFSRAMEQAAKESGVKEVADDLRKVTSPKSMGLDAVKSAADKFEKWDPLKNAAKPTKPLTPPPMPATSLAATTATAAPAAAQAAADVGPATAALYEKKAARKAVVDEAAAKLKAIATPAPAKAAGGKPAAKGSAATAPTADKVPGRRRKKPEVAGGDEA
jgi:sec-independent protein translocase protein TatB